MARDIVRGISRDCVRGVYSIALVSDAVFYLDVTPKTLAERNLVKRGILDFWKSGMDIRRSGDMYERFIDYQRKMHAELRRMEMEYKFETINGNRYPQAIHRELRSKVEKFLRSSSPNESARGQETVTNN